MYWTKLVALQSFNLCFVSNFLLDKKSQKERTRRRKQGRFLYVRSNDYLLCKSRLSRLNGVSLVTSSDLWSVIVLLELFLAISPDRREWPRSTHSLVTNKNIPWLQNVDDTSEWHRYILTMFPTFPQGVSCTSSLYFRFVRCCGKRSRTMFFL